MNMLEQAVQQMVGKGRSHLCVCELLEFIQCLPHFQNVLPLPWILVVDYSLFNL